MSSDRGRERAGVINGNRFSGMTRIVLRQTLPWQTVAGLFRFSWATNKEL